MDGMLWNWKEKGYTVTFDGKEDMEGTSCYKIKVDTKEGDSFTYYIDAEFLSDVTLKYKNESDGK